MQTRLHKLRRRTALSGDCMVLEMEGPIPETRSGQFYMLRTKKRWPVLLARPFSLYNRAADGEAGFFLLKIVGPGTCALAALEPGEEIWATGPLGRPFPEDIEQPVCVAGGIGLAPFLLLAQRWRELGREPVRLLFGGRSKDNLAGIEDFQDIARVHTCTDDGSHGFGGLVTDLMADLLQKGDIQKGETIFCCGPDPMMHAVVKLCAAEDLGCYLSLENYMGCGYGVCNGCSVRVKGERFGGWPYSKTCIEGPVYEADELVWDE
ncbi:MAG: dihydroorotate dehydrogenase electron transfer subunit [Planctomycetota bacterium]|jgi:dihydroorotate dehydrogenase electron transfer subunit